MNTWLHHPAYEYPDAITNWNKNWHEGGLYHREKPNFGAMMTMATGLAKPDVVIPAITEGKELKLTGEAAVVCRGFYAPINGLPDKGFT